MEVLGVFGATDVPGKTGLCGRSVPKGRPVLWSGVVGSKPGFSVSGGVAAPILFAGAVVPILFARAVVMELAAMAHVADNINPIAVKHIEVSFILLSGYSSTTQLYEKAPTEAEAASQGSRAVSHFPQAPGPQSL